MGRLSGKRALVTGAGGVMGSDFARGFAAEGAALVLTTRSPAKLEPLADEIRASGGRVTSVACDFTRAEDVDRLTEAAWNAFGGIDVVLLSSQPATPDMGDLLSTSDAAWQEQQQAVAWGPFRLLRGLVPKMIAAGSGASIVTVISSTGIDPIPGYGAYGLAKGQLWLLTRYMAAEWGRYGIRVNAICPGTVATGGSGAPSPEIPSARAMLNRTALGRFGASREVLGAAIHFASDEASFTTGQKIHVDGGRY